MCRRQFPALAAAPGSPEDSVQRADKSRSAIGETTPSDLHSRITERRSAAGPTLAESPSTQLSATRAARPPGWWHRRRPAHPRRMRSGGRTRAANPPASSQSRPSHELSSGHIGQQPSDAGWVPCRVKPSSHRPLRVRLEISLTQPVVRLIATRTPHRTGPRNRPEARLCCDNNIIAPAGNHTKSSRRLTFGGGSAYGLTADERHIVTLTKVSRVQVCRVQFSAARSPIV
jgi:hypothetical protein